MKPKNEIKKLLLQIRVKQEQLLVKQQERLKIKDWDKLIDKLTKRLFILWGLILLTIYLVYLISGTTI